MRFATQTSGKCKITWTQTSSNTAAGLTAANINNGQTGVALQNAVGVLITNETNDIRYTLDGTVPTSSAGTAFGHVMAAGAGIILDDPGQIQNFKFISKTAGSHGVIHASSFFAKL